MDINNVRLEIPEDCNVILGQTHFIKTAEDLYEIMATTVSQAKFGIAFTEASQQCLIRTEGNDDSLINVCVENLKKIGFELEPVNFSTRFVQPIDRSKGTNFKQNRGENSSRIIR